MRTTSETSGTMSNAPTFKSQESRKKKTKRKGPDPGMDPRSPVKKADSLLSELPGKPKMPQLEISLL